jgi:DNA-binding FadR family transcriptional regulator
MKSTPKHQAITSQLATEILAGKYGRTGRLPSQVQLVKRFGVARPTIGQALQSLAITAFNALRERPAAPTLPPRKLLRDDAVE